MTTFSTNLRLALQAVGENPDTWGDVANAGVFQLLEDAITKLTAIATTGGTTTLTTSNGASDQARCLCLDVTGNLGSNAILVAPNKAHLYLVRNGTSGAFTVTLKTSSGTGVAIPQGQLVILYSDGTNVVSVGITGVINADTLDSIDSTGFFILNAVNAITKGYREVTSVVADGATITLDVDAANVFRSTLGGNRTILVSNAAEGKWIEFTIVQDATGGRTLTWPANFQWAQGATPTLSSAPNASDVVYGRYDASAGVWRMSVQNSFNAGTGGTSTVIVAQNQVDVDLFALAGQPAGAVTVTLTINTGVFISASSAATPALSLVGFAAGSIINITNRGYILGHGGNGGRGGWAGTGDDTGALDIVPLVAAASAGTAGGSAVKGPGAGITVTIDNGSGFIWGGGGGGGGGGPSDDANVTGAGTGTGSAGGGGGGGAGSGNSGPGGSFAAALGVNGNPGGNGRLGTFGTAGAGVTTSGGSGTTISGGVGGDWGAAGTAGASSVTKAFRAPGGAGGAAGKAVDLNGGAVTISSGAGAPNVKGLVA